MFLCSFRWQLSLTGTSCGEKGAQSAPKGGFPLPSSLGCCHSLQQTCRPRGAATVTATAMRGVRAQEPLTDIPPQPQLPSSEPNFSNKNGNSVVHNREQFREYFAKFLWKQNSWNNDVSVDQPAWMTNSFFPYSHFHSSVQGAAGLENSQGSSGGSKALGFSVFLNTMLSPAPPCCLLWKPRSGGGNGPSPACRRCYHGLLRGWNPPDLGSVTLSNPVQRKGAQAWQPSPQGLWCFTPAITKRLFLLLSTAPLREEFQHILTTLMRLWLHSCFLSLDGFVCETARNRDSSLGVAEACSLVGARLPPLPVPRAIPKGPGGPRCLLGTHGAPGAIYTRPPGPSSS